MPTWPPFNTPDTQGSSVLRLQATWDLLGRYVRVFKASWSVRGELDPPVRLRHELAFLPASLELIDTPVHPAPRWTMVSIAALAIVATALALLGRLDIVASAHGKLVPSQRIKLIQPAITGVVRGIHVADGQQVAEGALLMELDPTQAAADSSKARSSRLAAAQAAARATALLDAQQRGRAPSVPSIEGADAADRRGAQRFADGLFNEYRDKLVSAQADLAKREAELQSTQHEIAKLRATAPLARQQAEDYKGLVERKYVSKTEYLDKEQTALQQEHEFDAQESHAKELQAAIAAQRSALAGITSQFRREQLDALDKAKQQLSQNRDDEIKAHTREGLMTLKAPVAGTVQQLAVHTLGGVVTTAQTLMEIVPDDAMEVDANRREQRHRLRSCGPAGDRQGRGVSLYPLRLSGRYRQIGVERRGAGQKGGLTFVARIRLPTNRMRIDEQWINLTPGMAVTAEVKTGTRSVARYFLDPLVQTSQESLRER